MKNTILDLLYEHVLPTCRELAREDMGTEASEFSVEVRARVYRARWYHRELSLLLQCFSSSTRTLVL